jgi:hypothetical protein
MVAAERSARHAADSKYWNEESMPDTFLQMLIFNRDCAEIVR